MHHPVVVGVLLGLAVAFTFLSTIGVMVMRDAFQRLHFPAVIVTFASVLIAAAVWVDERDPQARIKVMLIAVILYITNAVLTSATARAARIHRVGFWEPQNEQEMQIASRQEEHRA